jgi:hypothetical protein
MERKRMMIGLAIATFAGLLLAIFVYHEIKLASRPCARDRDEANRRRQRASAPGDSPDREGPEGHPLAQGRAGGEYVRASGRLREPGLDHVGGRE